LFIGDVLLAGTAKGIETVFLVMFVFILFLRSTVVFDACVLIQMFKNN